MNKARRKQIEAIRAAIADLKDNIQNAHDDLETIRGEEQDYYDNMPESIQGGDKGQKAEEVISELEDALSALESAADCLDDAISNMDTAVEE